MEKQSELTNHIKGEFINYSKKIDIIF